MRPESSLLALLGLGFFSMFFGFFAWNTGLALGGIAEMDEFLNLIETSVIGNFNQSEVYSVEVINDKVYFGLTDYTNFNKIKVISKDNLEVASYDVGKIPGDFAVWRK